MLLKNKLTWLLLSFGPIFFGLFFDSKYFKGRWFTTSRMGWIWLIQALWYQKILGFNRMAPVPIHHASKVSNWDNIFFHPDNLNNFQSSGCYFQNYAATITLSKGVYIAPNVGIITANHNPEDPDEVLAARDVFIGEKCWIGMNAVILPGVHLGSRTTVGAGAVVTRSFPDGNCIVGGSPARIIRSL